MGGENQGGLPDLDRKSGRVEIYPDSPRIASKFQTVGEASPIPIPTRPDPILVGILFPSRYLAQSWFKPIQYRKIKYYLLKKDSLSSDGE